MDSAPTEAAGETGRPHRQRDRLRLRAVGSNREGGSFPDWARAGGREPMEDDLVGRPHLGAHFLVQIHQPRPAWRALGFQASASKPQCEGCGRYAYPVVAGPLITARILSPGFESWRNSIGKRTTTRGWHR